MRRCIKATVGTVVCRQGMVLLEKRNHEPFYDHWCIPGGHIEFGEDVEAAMLRELKEETGLIAPSRRFFGYYTEYFPEIDWHAVALIFVVDMDGGNGSGEAVKKNLSPQEEEVKEIRWCTPEEVSELPMAFEHGTILSDFFREEKRAL